MHRSFHRVQMTAGRDRRGQRGAESFSNEPLLAV